MTTLEIHFDNGGGMLLQTDSNCHIYDYPELLAGDVRAILAGDDMSGWDGNCPEFRITEPHQETHVVTMADIHRAIESGEYCSRGNTETRFWNALLGIKS